MRPFRFAAPTALDEAVSVMAKAAKNGGGRVLVGGSDLIAQMKEGRRQPSVVVDIKRIPEMNRIEYVAREGLHVGAAVSLARTYEDERVSKRYPAIVDGARLVGSVQIQNRASLCGNVGNASPSADTVPGLLVYDAKVVVIGPKGQRTIPLAEVFAGPGRMTLAADEMILELIVPPPPANSSSHYMRFIPRNEMDIAVAGVASLVAIDKNGVCTRARIALAAVAPTVVRATDAEKILEGNTITPSLIVKAASAAVNHAVPITDVRGTIEYRKELVRVLTGRTLQKAVANLTGKKA